MREKYLFFRSIRPPAAESAPNKKRRKHAYISTNSPETKQQSAPNWGVPIFSAVATVALPIGMNKDEVITALESITTDLIVDIEDA